MITDTKSNTHNHRSTNHGLTQDASFSQQELEEDLLETLYGWWKEGLSVETTQLCLSMNISQQKLHILADQMVAHGYLEKGDNWESMKLTPYGKDQGAECLERHQYLTQFLQMICGLDKEQAEENACRMEHMVDTDVMHGIRDYLKYGDHYDRMIKNLNLHTLYKEGSYWFRGEIYMTGFIDGMSKDTNLKLKLTEKSANTKKTCTAHISQFGEYDVDVEVTVEDGIITDVKVTGKNFAGTHAKQNERTLQDAIDGLEGMYVGKSATDVNAIAGVDVVSGATYSSNAIRNAILNALDLEMPEEEITVPTESLKPGVYSVDIAYYTDKVKHSLVEDQLDIFHKF